jgi:hypothetical protein
MQTSWKDRTRILNHLKLKNTTKVLEIELYYHTGGMNFFAGQSEERGIYLSVTPAEIAKDSRTITAFSGTKLCLKPIKRFSRKEFNTFTYKSEDLQKLIDHVLRKNKLELL